MAKPSSKNKHSIIKKLLIFIAAITVVGIFTLIYTTTKTSSPYNYKFVYSYKGAINAYDLKTKTTVKLKDEAKTIRDINWNIDGKIAYDNDAGELYYLNPQTKESVKLLSSGVDGIFFWGKDSTIYAMNRGTDMPRTPNDKAYHINLDGTKSEISEAEYSNTLDKTLIDEIQPASSDKRFISKSSYLNNKDTNTFLIDTLDNKNYKMPPGAYHPQVSPDEKYVSYVDTAMNGGLTYIFTLDDAKKGKFDKPIFKKKFSDYEWMDESKILYSRSQIKPDVIWDFTYGVFDIATGKENTFYKISDSHVYLNNVILTQDRLELVLEKIPKDYSSGGDLTFIDIKSGKEVKKIPFEMGSWSKPL